jgi:hypothetical protein
MHSFTVKDSNLKKFDMKIFPYKVRNMGWKVTATVTRFYVIMTVHEILSLLLQK